MLKRSAAAILDDAAGVGFAFRASAPKLFTPDLLVGALLNVKMPSLVIVLMVVAPLPVTLNVDIAPLIVRFRLLLIVKAVNSLPLTLSESKVRPFLVLVSAGPRCALLKPAGKITSAPCKLFCIGGAQLAPLHFQLLTVLQLLLGPAPVQTT